VLEKAGKPTITVVTDQFTNLARLAGKGKGISDLRLAILPHPLAGLRSEVLEERGQALGEIIAKYLNLEAV